MITLVDRSILRQESGLCRRPRPRRSSPSVGLLWQPSSEEYQRADGTRRRIDRGVDVVRTGLPIPRCHWLSRIQVGSPQGHARRAARLRRLRRGRPRHPTGAAGPSSAQSPGRVPEGVQVLEECWEDWRRLPHHARSRIALACLPMTDVEENAIIVNALQRHATVVAEESGRRLRPSVKHVQAAARDRECRGRDRRADRRRGVGVSCSQTFSDLGAFTATIADLLADGERTAMGERARDRGWIVSSPIRSSPAGALWSQPFLPRRAAGRERRTACERLPGQGGPAAPLPVVPRFAPAHPHRGSTGRCRIREARCLAIRRQRLRHPARITPAAEPSSGLKQEQYQGGSVLPQVSAGVDVRGSAQQAMADQGRA